MFDLGFSEILFIAIIALLFIGPDKLPQTLKTIARTIGKIKRSFEDVKKSVNSELMVNELREEVLSYKKELEKAKEDLSAFKNIAAKEIDNIKQDIAKEYEPKSLDNDKELLEEFEKAEKEFEELEKEKYSKNQQDDLTNEITKHLQTEFKHLKKEDS